MVINPVKALLFSAGAAAAAAIAWAAVSMDPHLQGKPPVVAAVPPPTERAGEDAKAAPAAPPPTVAAEPAPQVVPPSFDLVRAEPDGSLVVAGRAAPNAVVEILSGSEVVGSTKAGPDGDFAAVLDNPLKPGDHQIVLRSTTADNTAAASPETAIVSIPEQPDGQVLALVEQPGEPSKLITIPEATPAPAAPADVAPAEVAAAPVEAADAQSAAATSGEEEIAESAQAETPKDAATAPEVAAAEPSVETAPTEMAAVAPSPAPADEAEPQAGAAAVDRPADVAADTNAEAEAAPAEMAAVAPDAASAPSDASESAIPPVAVEALEIEGDKVFVAGVAEPGKVVRVYANEILLGEATTSPAGRFLVEAVRELPVGDYIVRADLLEANGAEVLARAAVPFEREAGETIAAIAPSVGPAPQVMPAPADAAAEVQTPPPVRTEEDVASADTPPQASPDTSEAASAASVEPAPEVVAEDASPTVAPAPTAQASGGAGEEEEIDLEEQVAEAPLIVEPAPPAAVTAPDAPAAEASAEPLASEVPAPAASGGEQPVVAEAPIAPAQSGSSAIASAPQAEAAPQVADAAPAPAIPAPTVEPMLRQQEGAAEQDQMAAVSARESPSASASDAGQVPTVTAPKLESVPSAVIIRRGDNLWRISRRVYGHGMRYTTIYLANQTQIRNPDLIFPGQVFSVPEKTEEGIPADMEAIRERMAEGGSEAAAR